MVAFADALKAQSGGALVRAEHVSSQLPLPRELPDVVAATPAALMAATEQYGHYAGWEWTKEGIVARCAPLEGLTFCFSKLPPLCLEDTAVQHCRRGNHLLHVCRSLRSDI